MFCCCCCKKKANSWQLPIVVRESTRYQNTEISLEPEQQSVENAVVPTTTTSVPSVAFVENGVGPTIYRTQRLNDIVEVINELDSNDESTDDVSDEEKITKRRSGLASQPLNISQQASEDIQIVQYPKSKADKAAMQAALNKNDFLSKLLEGPRLEAVIDAMYIREVSQGEVIIQEGTVGSHLYISATGIFQVVINGQLNLTFNDQRVFGELAILYNAKRQASIKVAQSGQVWVLDRPVYQNIMLKNAMARHELYLNFLRRVPKLNTKNDRTLGRVADLLKQEFFATGMVIVKQGDPGDKFYIISAGSVTVSKHEEGVVGQMLKGEFFGQLALLKEDSSRQATVTADAPGVECLTLSRTEFIQHFGDINNIDEIPPTKKRSVTQYPYIGKQHQDVALDDLKIVGTLGVGGFGRVELVRHRQQDLVFALKYLKKRTLVDLNQKEHAFNEKVIQSGCNCMFIVQLYKTFKDERYLYFLMEPCLGGDLFGWIQKQRKRRFDETAAKFYTACVLEAFAYLHERGVVYRDLKPENLMLDRQGYLKLTDFGFAKKLESGERAYTFAGTPEYVSPEVIYHRGHNKGTDYWTLGIFIYELLTGSTPFRSNDPTYMSTYTLIINGIERARFPESIPEKAKNIIKKLCRPVPAERLGCQKDGAQAVKSHKWFMGFEWEQLYARKLKAPITVTLKNDTDLRYFEKFDRDTQVPPIDVSGWDEEF